MSTLFFLVNFPITLIFINFGSHFYPRKKSLFPVRYLNLNAFPLTFRYIFFSPLKGHRNEGKTWRKIKENIGSRSGIAGKQEVVRCWEHARRKSRDVFTVTRTRQQAKDEGRRSKGISSSGSGSCIPSIISPHFCLPPLSLVTFQFGQDGKRENGEQGSVCGKRQLNKGSRHCGSWSHNCTGNKSEYPVKWIYKWNAIKLEQLNMLKYFLKRA